MSTLAKPARDMDLQAIYENLPIALCLIGRDGRLLVVNAVHARLAGRPAGDLVGMRVADLHEEGGRNIIRDFSHFDQGLPVPDHEIEIRGRQYLISTSPVRDNTGAVVAISVAHIDITERRTAQLKSARMARQLRELATQDHLTKTYNRREFDRLLRHHCNAHRRSGRHFSLLIFDVDHFKSYNDLYGHQAGDECLRAVAGAARRTLRSSETVLCRYGGEEFAAIVRDVEFEVATAIGERLIESVGRLGLPHQHGIGHRVTISCGLATSLHFSPAPPPQTEIDMLLAADRALYDAKASGRNALRVSMPR